MTRRDAYRQRRLDQVRSCLTCGAPLAPERRGYYCPTHGHEERPAETALLNHCRGCGRVLRGGRSLCLRCVGGAVA